MSWQTPARSLQASAAMVSTVGGARRRTRPRRGPARRPRARPRPAWRSRRAISRARATRSSGGRDPVGEREELGVHVGDLALRSSSQTCAAAPAGERSVCDRRRGGHGQRLVRVEHLERGDLGAPVVAVGVGPRRRRDLDAGVARRSARAWSAGVSRASLNEVTPCRRTRSRWCARSAAACSWSPFTLRMPTVPSVASAPAK